MNRNFNIEPGLVTYSITTWLDKNKERFSSTIDKTADWV